MRKVLKLIPAFAAFAVLLFLFSFYRFLNGPVSGTTDSSFFTIAHGESINSIADRLEDDGLVRSRVFFRAIVRITNSSRYIKAGVYDINGGMRSTKILRVIRLGMVAMEKFTIPEGLYIRQVARLLDEKGIVDEEEFVRACSDRRILDRFGIPFDTAEGFIFPDTYIVAKDFSEEQIVEVAIGRFFDALKEVPFTGYSNEELKRIVIVASLVEKEAKLDEERALVAAVFYNRLENGKRLEACSTIQYILGKSKERLLYSDLKISSPYNTYLNGGLPPGPIASPGLSSLRAAVFPSDVDYLFFVSKRDGSHHFSTTYEEHLKAIERYNGVKRFTHQTS
ncbi:MAG: endolytic transglycosylase MltG [Spirochaetes bacterium]|nr:endolytic transglycosylase MltG [Spirochaetota bacterium]